LANIGNFISGNHYQPRIIASSVAKSGKKIALFFWKNLASIAVAFNENLPFVISKIVENSRSLP
jgi:hypothetical protein